MRHDPLGIDAVQIGDEVPCPACHVTGFYHQWGPRAGGAVHLCKMCRGARFVVVMEEGE